MACFGGGEVNAKANLTAKHTKNGSRRSNKFELRGLAGRVTVKHGRQWRRAQFMVRLTYDRTQRRGAAFRAAPYFPGPIVNFPSRRHGTTRRLVVRPRPRVNGQSRGDLHGESSRELHRHRVREPFPSLVGAA